MSSVSDVRKNLNFVDDRLSLDEKHCEKKHSSVWCLVEWVSPTEMEEILPHNYKKLWLLQEMASSDEHEVRYLKTWKLIKEAA